MEVQDKPKITTPYINLQSDYGFKRLFGTEEFRGALLQFSFPCVRCLMNGRSVKMKFNAFYTL